MKKLQIAVALTVLFGVPAILFAGASIVHLIAQVPTLISSGTVKSESCWIFSPGLHPLKAVF